MKLRLFPYCLLLLILAAIPLQGHASHACDHQGNIRVVMGEDGTLEQVTHYYLFGGIYGDAGLNAEFQPCKYNGKELDRMHGLDWYDYGARQYDAAGVPVFTTIDPMAEKYYHLSPYAYCANNPIKYIDKDGKYLETFWDVANVMMGVYSFSDNISQGNFGAAFVDGVGILADAIATVFPIPGGAGMAIQSARLADKATDAVKAASKVDDAVDAARTLEKGANPAEGRARFVGDVDGKLIDTHATPKGTYVQPNGAETDILGREHFNKIGNGKVESVGTSHTHNQGRNIDRSGNVHEFREDNAHVPTFEEVTNITNEIAKKKKRK